ncbi:hypothetical protein CJF42_23930, partial [Pseudoalteromonas sp. NBT06-2]|uniref:methyl-accepting chemotaxis protein n=1 Tax=Pseudoalteromonas sp. NBT06-2 TaxID=2025950 RepID=UPI000BCFE836
MLGSKNSPWLKLSMTARLVLSVCSIISVILLVISIIVINRLSDETTSKIQSSLSRVVETEASNITQLFLSRYKVLETAFEAPSIKHWIETREKPWEEIDGNIEYNSVNQYFKSLVTSEDEITSIFYSPMKTGEYWDENGRIPREYMTSSIKTVPWWIKTKQADQGVVNEPFEDSRTKVVSAALSMPVYSYSGKLIAIAGLDLKLEVIQQHIKKNVKFNGLGNAFLFQESGQLITLPEGVKFDEKDRTLNSLEQSTNTSGFFQLINEQKKLSFHRVIYNGIPQIVALIKIESTKPLMDWRLALMYPQEKVDEPIIKTTIELIVFTFILIISLGFLLSFLIKLGLKPLSEISDAMTRIVNGDGDLTQRLIVKDKNEIGKLAQMFNEFVSNINHVVKESLNVSTQVSNSSERLQSMMEQADDAVQSQNAELDMIATATTELSQAVNEISSNAESSSQATIEVQNQVYVGMELVTKADLQINTLANSFRDSETLVTELNVNSDKIGEVLDVIGSIADQTNLLALNAAIEAARAGDHGRGFTVVADEVRTLAKQTQDSTSNIQSIINTLRDNTKQVLTVMVDNRQHAEQSVEDAKHIHQQLTKLTVEVENIQSQSLQIARQDHYK